MSYFTSMSILYTEIYVVRDDKPQNKVAIINLIENQFIDLKILHFIISLLKDTFKKIF